MNTLLRLLIFGLLISGCKPNIERNPDAWKDWDYSVHGTTPDGRRKVVGDITMDNGQDVTGSGLIMDDLSNEIEVTIRKISDSQMTGVDKDGNTYKLTIDSLRYGEPAH